MYGRDAMEILESLVNGQAKQATQQFHASDLSLYELVNTLRDKGYSDTQILDNVRKLRV